VDYHGRPPCAVAVPEDPTFPLRARRWIQRRPRERSGDARNPGADNHVRRSWRRSLLMVFKPFSDGALIFKSVYLNVFTSDKHYSMNFRYYVLLDFLGVLIRRTG
jgi:hypothetical protein